MQSITPERQKQLYRWWREEIRRLLFGHATEFEKPPASGFGARPPAHGETRYIRDRNSAA